MGFFYSGGGERTVLNQAKGLQERGHEVKIYAPIVEEDCFPELVKEVELIQLSNKIPEKMPLKTALAMLDSSIRIPTKVFEDREILIAHGQPSNWIAYNVSKKTKIPYVSYLHQANRFLHPRKIDQKTGWNTYPSLALLNILHKRNMIVKKLDYISITRSRVIFTNSNWIRVQLQQIYGKNAIICYPGVDEQRFTPSNNKAKNYILTTNRHIPQKRLDYLLLCIKKISRKYPEIKCKITGERTPYTRELEKIVKKLHVEKNIEFTGKLSFEKLVSAYQNAYTYAYTSPEEDFGLGPLEAGACCVPSIVWDHAGPRETVINDKTGFRIKPYDVDLMAKKHVELIENPELRDNLGINARHHIESMFTWEKHCSKVEKVLEKMFLP